MQTAVAGVNHNEQHLLSCVCVWGGSYSIDSLFCSFLHFFSAFSPELYIFLHIYITNMAHRSQSNEEDVFTTATL